MYEIRYEAWKVYRKGLNSEPLENWEDLRNAFNAGWKSRKDQEYNLMKKFVRSPASVQIKNNLP